jgi:porphobilinogen synthase
MRRLRKTLKIRKLVRETVLTPNDLIYPIFVKEDINTPEPIESMPGQFRLPIDEAVKEAENIASLGIPAIILFGIPAKKDNVASSAYDPDGIIQRTVRSIKDHLEDKLSS